MLATECSPRKGDIPSRSSRDVPPLCVIVVSYNSGNVLPGLLDSIEAGMEGVGHYEIVVADNSSLDDSVAIALSHPIRPRVLAMGRNAGYAAGINAAAATVDDHADILVLNPDIRLYRGSVRSMRAALNDPSVGIVVPQMLHEDGTLSMSIRREPSLRSAWAEALIGGRLAARLGLGEVVLDVPLYHAGGPIEWATGAAMLIAAHARARLGDWDESFFLYSEEVDYFLRLREAGLRALYVPGARVVHIGGDCHRSAFLSALLTKNRIGYFSRHHGVGQSFIFRLGIVLGELIRSPSSPAHRASLKAALRRA